jgi:hypothetical protein
MRSATLLAPVTAAERHLVAVERRITAAPRRSIEIDFEELVRSLEISEEEILDDLRYPGQ